MRMSTGARNKLLLVTLLMLVVVSVASCAGKPTNKATAESIVDSMVKGDFASATKDFNATMKSQLPAEKLGEVWAQLTAQVGPFKSRTGTREVQEQEYNVVYVTCKFEKSSLDVKVVFDDNRQVAGLFIGQAE